MKHVDRTGFFISIAILIISTIVGEVVKILVASQNVFITLGFGVLAVIIILIVYAFNEKRIANGKNAQSIAIRSSKFIDDYYRHVKQIVNANGWKDNEKEIYKTIQSISRHLLLIGEYKVRYSLGKIVYKKTNNVLYKMKSLIDEMGWTSVLMGKKRAVKEIEKAIELSGARFFLTKGTISVQLEPLDDLAYEKLFLVCRGLRHLASVHFKSLEERIDLSNKALAIIALLEKDKEKLPADLTDEKISDMKAGIHYGLGLANLIGYSNKMILSPEAHMEYLAQAEFYNQAAKEVAKNATNKHRYLKCLLVENEIFNAVTTQNILPLTELQKEATKNKSFSDIMAFTLHDYSRNLNEVENILNSSIYIDEAYEMFLEEKIRPEVYKK